MGQLRVVLVDDETIVLRGIQHILSKSKDICEVVGTANSGFEALDVLANQLPDVLITDVKMPDMNGIELLQQAKSLYPELNVIVLSGHAEFEYARDSLRYGAYDYLLKPCKHKEISKILTEIYDNTKLENQTCRQKETLVKYLQSSHQQIKKRQLMDLLTGKSSDYTNVPNKGHLYLGVLAFEEAGHHQNRVRLMVEETLLPWVRGYEGDIINYENQSILMCYDVESVRHFKEQLYQFKLKAQKEGILICGGLMNIRESNHPLYEAYKQCLIIVEYLQFNELNEIMDMEGYSHHFSKAITPHKSFDEEKIIKYLCLGKCDEIEKILSKNLKALTSQNLIYDPTSTKNYIKQLMILVEKKMNEKDITFKMIFNKEVESMLEVEKRTYYRQLFNWLKNMLMAIVGYIEENQKHLPKSIQKAITYINQYYDKEISMQEVAKEVYLNPWYFSDLFKEKVGVCFSDYVTSVRLQQAKELLCTTDLKNYEIAQKVGFRNATYFNVVFKKFEGMTPKVYRKCM